MRLLAGNTLVEDAGYRPDIDGLRAIAVGLVVLYHSGLMFSGGFVGVDVFFVISGFLITRLILTECDENIFTLRAFWLRRIRRILPAAAVAVAATLVVGSVLLPPREQASLADSAVAQQLGVANFYFWAHGGYFDLPAELKPLLHTWSLAVEEQFYLLWPVLLLLLHRSRRSLAWSIAILIVATLALSEMVTRRQPSTAFFLMPARIWELLLGAAILFCPRVLQKSLRRSPLYAILGLLLIVVAASMYTPVTPFPGLSAVAPCLGAFFIIAAPSPQRVSMTSILGLPPLVYVGRASYSIYLWHWPLLVYSKILFADQNGPLTSAWVVLASLTVGGLSYAFIETPFRNRFWAAPNTHLVLVCGLFATLICISSLSIRYYVTANYAQLLAEDVGRNRCEQTREPVPPDADWPKSESYWVVLGEKTKSQSPTFVLWGDSHANAIAPLCDKLASSRQICGAHFSQGGCAPLVGVWCNNPALAGKEPQLDWNRQVVEWIKKKHIRHIILAARWESKVPPPSSQALTNLPGLLGDSHSLTTSPEDARRVWQEAFPRTVATFGSLGTRIWFLKQVPTQKSDPFGRLAGVPGRGIHKQAYEMQLSEIDRVLASCASPLLTVLGPGKNWFDHDGYSRTGDEHDIFYSDFNHLSHEGAEKLIRPLLEPVFDTMAARGGVVSDAR